MYSYLLITLPSSSIDFIAPGIKHVNVMQFLYKRWVMAHGVGAIGGTLTVLHHSSHPS